MRSVPWHVKGVAPAARETAQKAAQRSGLSVGAWLNSVIFGSASGEAPPLRRHRRPGRNASAIHARLDTLTRQIDRLAEAGAPAPDTYGGETVQQLADAIGRLDRRLDQLIQKGRQATGELDRHATSVDRALAALGRERLRTAFVGGPENIDQAVAEIAARQHVLDSAPADALAPLWAASPVAAGPEAYAPPPRFTPVSAGAQRDEPDLSGLEAQLRHITAQFELLQRPCPIDEAVAALRQDLADIGRKLNEAMPRRALDALEGDVRRLAAEIEASRQSDANAAGIAGLERGLGEVRDALRALTPAESLVGFDEAVKTLSRKIDVLAGGGPDPAALRQLESAVDGLRGIVSHVASGEALAAVAADVKTLASRIDLRTAAPANDVLTTLDQRIAAIADAIEASRREGHGAAPPALDALMRSLSDKVETLQLSRTDQLALGNLEERITRLVEKLDASETRLGHLGAIERGMAELLVHLEELRTAPDARAPRGTAGLASPAAPPPAAVRTATLPAAAVPPVETLTRDVAEIRQAQTTIGRRTDDSLDAVQDTIGDVVSRLAMIETDLRNDSRPAAPDASRANPVPPPPGAPAAVRAGEPVSAPIPKPHAPPREPIDPTLPPDYPLEPGSGAPRMGASPADRIAASEVPLQAARTGVQAEGGDAQDFLQAARRAARAASRSHESGSDGTPATEATTLSDRLKQLFVGAGVVLAVAAAFRFAGIYLDPERVILADAAPPRNEVARLSPGLPVNPPATLPARLPAGMPATARAIAVPDDFQSPAPPAPGPVVLSVPVADAATIPAPAPGNSVVAPPAAGPTLAMAPASDITGSVPARQDAAAVKPAAPAAPVPAPGASAQGIGKGLMAAAISGDAVADYEIASRYAEGRGVPQGYQEAAVWYGRAAKRGLAPAQFRLGTMYEKGLGVGKNLQEARRFYLAAAGKGNAKAMHNIAVLYAEGIDGKPDYRTAVEWFRRAANYGVADSQYNLAVLCARGIGTGLNLTEAYKWFALAANTGDQESAKKRDEIAARLDKPSLAAARLAVRSFTVSVAPEEATTVKLPAGGWEPTSAPAAARSRPQARATAGSAKPR